MDSAVPLKPFPLARYLYHDHYQSYFGYGSAPPDNYLENITDEKEPVVLLLSCGDMRSCMYTIWRNFDRISNRFNGAHFVMNDDMTAILARNVLFLYLCLKMPREKHLVMGWVSAIWAIWFCHELLPEHEAILNSALAFLIKCAGSKQGWSSSRNPLSSLVKFTSAQGLSEISQVWQMWYEKDVKGIDSVEAMNAVRQAEYKKMGYTQIIDNNMVSIGLITAALGVFACSELSDESRECMEWEVNEYIKTGTVFVEEMFKKSNLKSNTRVNYTFFARGDGKYTFHYALVPYRCFYHTYEYSPAKLKKLKFPKSILDSLLIKDDCYECHPLLANSVQQFVMWLQSCARVLKQENGSHFSFTFHCSNPILFCQELQSPLHAPHLNAEHMYDLIYTSNLMDLSAAPNLVLSAIPLLKPSGHLFTMTLLYKSIGSTAEEYLKKCFGFESKLLPALFGIRCINHEGDRYSSNVSAQLIPWEIGNAGLTNQWPKLLVWQRVDNHPQKVISLASDSAVTEALFQSICLCVSTLILEFDGCRTFNYLCVESAIKILQMYARVHEADISDHHFWSPLCEKVIPHEIFNLFRNSFQTHCLLHDMHLHLTFTDLTCPICRGEPISQHVSRYCIELRVPLKGILPMFMAFIHHTDFENPIQLFLQVKMGVEIQVADCLVGEREGDKLKVSFYWPSSYAEAGYNVTLVSYMVGHKHRTRVPNSREEDAEVNMPYVECRRKLAKCLASDIIHYFQTVESPPPCQPSDFGSVISHSSTDGDYFETVILLNDTVLSNLESGTGVTTKHITSSEVEICCGSLSHKIHYPHPIEYNRLAVKISRKKKNVTILAARAAHNFEEEKALFLVDPDNWLSLVPVDLNEQILTTFCHMQYTTQDRDEIETCRREIELMSPMVNLKESLNILLESQDEYFFHVILPGGGAFAVVMINNRVYDIHRKTPAIDLAYCFPEQSNVLRMGTRWQKIMPETVRGIRVNDGDYELFKKVFLYFAERTIGQVKNARGRLQLLVQQRIDHYFTRAVVYPLYSDPDSYVLEMDLSKKVTENLHAVRLMQTPLLPSPNNSLHKCKFCKKESTKLKLCAGCCKTYYCGQVCQFSHWKEHQPKCSKMSSKESTSSRKQNKEASLPTNSNTSVTQKCSLCNTTSTTLSKCPKCSEVFYCGYECMVKHFVVHKVEEVRAQQQTLLSHSDPPSKLLKCGYCGMQSKNLKRCVSCGKVYYCNRECQKKHWKEHKPNCHRASDSEPTVTSSKEDEDKQEPPVRCDCCKDVFPSLKRCPCHQVAYCSTTCQRKDWSNHKMVCSAKNKV